MERYREFMLLHKGRVVSGPYPSAREANEKAFVLCRNEPSVYGIADFTISVFVA